MHGLVRQREELSHFAMALCGGCFPRRRTDFGNTLRLTYPAELNLDLDLDLAGKIRLVLPDGSQESAKSSSYRVVHRNFRR